MNQASLWWKLLLVVLIVAAGCWLLSEYRAAEDEAARSKPRENKPWRYRPLTPAEVQALEDAEKSGARRRSHAEALRLLWPEDYIQNS